ncbi:universal stress protein [Marivivens niveibacter]|uniref:Universal stress protein n=1 Tax=Marivivens niveibacter TaxID=1930667 RepID=A0A251X0Z1_9RHOB|nr:universal stress protein [Marivivens niveibacter]OUD09833.1 universal stress protein [Marivivens niveibacter]
MTYKTIAVIITDSAADTNALETAINIADRTDAHVNVTCIGIDPARYDAIPAGGGAALIEVGAKEARTLADSLEKWVRTQVANVRPSVSIESVVMPQMGVETMVARIARYSDLIVATKPYGAGRGPVQVNVLEAELFGTGVPVLIVPETGPIGSEPFSRVAIAWNESSEAFAAIRASLPVLMAADRVDIVMVDPPSHSPERSDPGGAVCLLLARHGVRAEVSILARTLPRVSDVIDRFAAEHGVELIVMGAYGHSRFREAMLGGATRDTLEATTLPLLMTR